MDRAERLESLLPGLLRQMFRDTEDQGLHDLPLAQLRILRLLLERPMTAGEVADTLGLSASALSQLTQRLQKSGFIVKSKDGQDARIKHLALSPKGQVAMEHRRSMRVERARFALARLNESEQIELMRLLEKLTQGTRESWIQPLERITA